MSTTICGQCHGEIREDLIHTCSPQMCPTCGKGMWLGHAHQCDSPTRPEGLDFEMAENGASVHPYTVRVDEKIRARLNAQHRAALDALRAEYAPLEEAVREWQEARVAPRRSDGLWLLRKEASVKRLAALPLPEVSE